MSLFSRRKRIIKKAVDNTVKALSSKNSGKIATQSPINTNESINVKALSLVSGKQSLTRLKKPVIVKVRIASVSVSSGKSIPNLPKTITVATFTKIKSALGKDFFSTVEINCPSILRSFGSSAKIKDGIPITNSSRRISDTDPNGYVAWINTTNNEKRNVKNVFIRKSVEDF